MSSLEHIHAILVEQVEGYRTLLSTLQRERECLVQFDPDGVEALSKEKDTLVLKLRLLEEERTRLVRAFAAEAAIPEQDAFRALSERLGDDRFQRLRLQLVSLLQSIGEMNEFNRVLIDRSSAIVKNALGFLGSVGIGISPTRRGTLLSREA